MQTAHHKGELGAFRILRRVPEAHNAVIQEVERGENYIKGKFEAALKDDDLDPAYWSVLEQAHQSVKAGHDRASTLKHSIA